MGFIKKIAGRIQEDIERRKVAEITGRAERERLRAEVRSSPEFETFRKKKIMEVEKRKLSQQFAKPGGGQYNVLHELGRSAQLQFGEGKKKEKGGFAPAVGSSGAFGNPKYLKELLGGGEFGVPKPKVKLKTKEKGKTIVIKL